MEIGSKLMGRITIGLKVAAHCTLMVMIDDANGKLQNLQFFARENRDAHSC